MADRALFLSAEDTRALLTWDDAIQAIERVYSAELNKLASPRRSLARGQNASLRALSGALPSGTLMGTKIFGISRLGGLSYVIVLFDQAKGTVECFLDASVITAVRTAATTAVAVKKLAGSQPVRLGVLGTGTQAYSHVRALSRVLSIREVVVFSPKEDNRARFCAALSEELSLPFRLAASNDEVVRNCDVLLGTARPYQEEPVILGEWLRPGMVVASVGSTLPEQREADPETLQVADMIVVDAKDEIIAETGDFIAAKQAGVDFEHKVFSLNDLLLGNTPPPRPDSQILLFKSIGAGIQDIALAEVVYTKARELGIGRELPGEIVLKRRQPADAAAGDPSERDLSRGLG